MKILVTGGAGLIGSNLVLQLVKYGKDVSVVDNLWRGKKENLYKDGQAVINIESKFFERDLCDYSNCIDVTRGIDAVVHLADIVAGINFVFENEYLVFHSNMLINSNMLRASIKNSVRRYLYVGTACSYPLEKQNTIDPPPLREEDAYPANPESSYGWSKLMGEYECGLAEKEDNIKTSVLRLHNVYGAPCDISVEKSQVIPALCRKAVNYPDEDFIVWGSGKQKRAFLYVSDVVDAIIAAIDKGMNKGVIQIGPTMSHAISDVAERIVSLSGKDIEIKYDVTKPEGDRDRMANNNKAKEVLDWVPHVSLDKGLEQTFRWVREKLKG